MAPKTALINLAFERDSVFRKSTPTLYSVALSNLLKVNNLDMTFYLNLHDQQQIKYMYICKCL